jgi:hypothetical protein
MVRDLVRATPRTAHASDGPLPDLHHLRFLHDGPRNSWRAVHPTRIRFVDRRLGSDHFGVYSFDVDRLRCWRTNRRSVPYQRSIGLGDSYRWRIFLPDAVVRHALNGWSWRKYSHGALGRFACGILVVPPAIVDAWHGFAHISEARVHQRRESRNDDRHLVCGGFYRQCLRNFSQ